MATANTSTATAGRPESIGLSAERLSMAEVRASVNRAVTAWGFGSAFSNLSAGAVYAAFARQIGADQFIFGVLAAALPLMSLLQVFAARRIERTGRTKRQMLVAGILGRSVWVVIPLLPLLAHYYPHLLSPHAALWLFLAGVLFSGACQAFTTPAFFSWMTDLIPQSARSTFFAKRIVVGLWVTLIVVLLSGKISDIYGSLLVNAVILALAGIAGIIDIAFFLPVPEPATEERDSEMPSLFTSLREPLRDLAVRNFLMFTGLFTCSVAFFGPFVWLYCMEKLGFDKLQTGLVLVIAPSLGAVCSTKYWGAVAKRDGNRPVLRLCAVGMMLTPFGWLITHNDSAAYASLLAMQFLAGMLATGVDLACQTTVTRLAPEFPRPTIVALFFVVWGACFAVASTTAGFIAKTIGDTPIHVARFTLDNYQVLFLIAFIIRFATSIIIAPYLKEPGSTSARATFKGIVPEIAQAFTARVTRPFGLRDEEED